MQKCTLCAGLSYPHLCLVTFRRPFSRCKAAPLAQTNTRLEIHIQFVSICFVAIIILAKSLLEWLITTLPHGLLQPAEDHQIDNRCTACGIMAVHPFGGKQQSQYIVNYTNFPVLRQNFSIINGHEHNSKVWKC